MRRLPSASPHAPLMCPRHHAAYHGANSILAPSPWSLLTMVRSPALAITALAGLLLLAGCGAFGQAGLSVPHSSDGVQTVSDAADLLDAHRSSATENAKTAIAVTDALGSVIRDVSGDERF